MTRLLSDIAQYWNKRALSYSEYVLSSVDNDWECLWADTLISNFPAKNGESFRVLDIGTGPGYYALILAKRGYSVTAVDYSDGMLEIARQNAGKYAQHIVFARMNAHCLDFEDNSFDVVVSRNLTWNLEEPAKAYADWFRVLRSGGRMINYDANWYAYLFDEKKKMEFEQDKINTILKGVTDYHSYEDSQIMEEISRKLPLGRLVRPQWDLTTLLNIGFSKVSADITINDRLLSDDEKTNCASTPGFLICAEK